MASTTGAAGLALGERGAGIPDAAAVHGAQAIATAVRALSGLNVTVGPAGGITVAVAPVSPWTLALYAAICIFWDGGTTAVPIMFIRQIEWASLVYS